MEAKLESEQRKPLTDDATSIQDRLDAYNARSVVWEDDDRAVFVFDYAKTQASAAGGRSEIINRHVLRRLKDRGHWNVIRHPLVLNYVNEKLLSCTLFYSVHVAAYFLFLFLLYSYIHGPPSVTKNLIVTGIVLFFVFFLLIKAALRLQDGARALSVWFALSYLFNILTYGVTLFYVWSFHFFNFDNYHEDVKQTVAWFLPIIAILSSWINCLYVLRKAPCGPYILMMSKILFSFLNTTIIWIPTLFCFAFSFQLVMRDSGREPWDIGSNSTTSTSSSSLFMAMFSSFTKTSAMMIGEVEANDILERRAWVANLLLILFEIITVILLMNLMISLAVGDVNELRISAEERLLKIKVNFCIEALHLSEQVAVFEGFCGIRVLHKQTTNNVLVVYKNEDRAFSKFLPGVKQRFFAENIVGAERRNEKRCACGHLTASTTFHSCLGPDLDSSSFYSMPSSSLAPPLRAPIAASESFVSCDLHGLALADRRGPSIVYELVVSTTGLRVRKEALTNRAQLMSLRGVTLRLAELPASGVAPLTDSTLAGELARLAECTDDDLWRRFQRWLLGLNWRALLVL